MRTLKQAILLTSMGCLLLAMPAWAAMEMEDLPSTKNRLMHQESAQQHKGPPPPPVENPSVPDGMTLDDVLDYSATPPPAHFPDPVPDDKPFAFLLFDQLEYRIGDDNTPDHLGWETDLWAGGDFNKFWWKSEGEAIFEGEERGEAENDFLYSRLITPFWNLQAGFQYASEWGDDYEDRWSGVLAFQGMAPYKFEIDSSLYLSEDADLTAAVEAEYDIRVTQRLVLQPRTGLHFSAQDIPERMLGQGLTDVDLDLRLRYEIIREFAPYVGVRYHFLVGETDNMAEAAGEDTEQVYLLLGARIAF